MSYGRPTLKASLRTDCVNLKYMGPLENLEQWDDFVQERYDPNKSQEEFRQYDDSTPPVVREFYRLNHTHQTLDFVRQKKQQYLARQKSQMSIWEAMEFLNTLVDDSDPDTDLSQIEHQCRPPKRSAATGIRAGSYWTGLIHDLGKVLCLFGEPQWAVVGDTFPVGCAYSDKIVFPEFFAANPDREGPEYQTACGIYEEGCGLDNVDLSWGHDEYLYHVVKDYLPEEALYMIRYHSFYPRPSRGRVRAPDERPRSRDVRVGAEFNPYDLYSKGTERPKLSGASSSTMTIWWPNTFRSAWPGERRPCGSFRYPKP